MPHLQNALIFLSSAVISFALYLVLLRFWMQWVRADFRNELGQLVITVTDPLVIPLRKIIPPVGSIDTATFVLAYAVAIVKIVVVVALLQESVSVIQYLVWGFGLLLRSCIYLFIAAIFISIVASWVAPHSYHPIVNVARSISEPLMAPARRLIPSFGGIDFSPILVLLFLQVSLILFVQPILPRIF